MKIKTPKLLSIILTASFLLAASIVNAQSVTPTKLRFGIGVEGLLPVGNSSNYLNMGLGITPRLQYTLSDKVGLTFTSGIYHFFPKTVTYSFPGVSTTVTGTSKSDVIPVKAGAKFFIGSNIYLAGEAGAAFEVADGSGPVYFLASPGIGYATKRLDIGARYENFSGKGSRGIIGLRIAYGFGL